MKLCLSARQQKNALQPEEEKLVQFTCGRAIGSNKIAQMRKIDFEAATTKNCQRMGKVHFFLSHVLPCHH